MGILLYPFFVLLFWYGEGLKGILSYFASLDDYCIRLFSLNGLFHTFFKPLKNEYRKNLVLFSILFGIMIKSFLIVASLVMLSVVIIIELCLVVLYLSFPILPLLLFIKMKYF